MTEKQLHEEKNQIVIREYKDVSIKASKKDGDYDEYMKTYSDKIVPIEDEEEFRKKLREEITKLSKKLSNSEVKDKDI